jgi:hypothetical protein
MNINLSYNELIIGNSIEALIQAAITNTPVLVTHHNPYPPERLFTAKKNDYSTLALHLFSYSWGNAVMWDQNGTKIYFGPQYRSLYNHALFILSLAGKIPFSDKILGIRIVGEHHLEVVTGDNIVPVKFNHLTIYDDDKILGIDPDPAHTVPEEQRKYDVHDYFYTAKMSCAKNIDIIHNPDSDGLVKDVYVYRSRRFPFRQVSAKQPFRDVLVVSELSEKELEEEGFSENNVKILALRLMEKYGIHGWKSHSTINKFGEKVYYYHTPQPIIQFARREIRKKFKITYQNTQSISFNNTLNLDDMIGLYNLNSAQRGEISVLAYKLCRGVRKIDLLNKSRVLSALANDYDGTRRRFIEHREFMRKAYISFLSGNSSKKHR